MAGVVRDLGLLFILLAAVVLGSYLIRLFWDQVLKRIARRTRTKLDTMIIEATERPAFLLVLLGGFYLVFQRFSTHPALAGTPWLKVINGVFFVAAAIAFTRFLYALIKAILDWYLAEVAVRTETRVDEEFIPLFARLLKVILYFIAITVILGYFKVNLTGFIATAGVASLALALAAQETIANWISGFAIMVDRPFKVGDRIELPDGQIGDVYEIGLRSTRIRTFDNNLLIVPNTEMAKSRVLNFRYPSPQARIAQTIGVAYGSDLDKVKRVLLEICANHPDVLKEPPPGVYFTEFGESALKLFLSCWVAAYRDLFRVQDELNMEIKRRFEQEGIEIPFPKRDVRIRRE
ncbi:MAG: mechanosensitive ion channel [Candidatus Acetothermia bacterium]|jgi:small-conductance mechanosensitive channel|nr:mechanosensitive ion channel [Candidatus Acetothermia bacterium]MDH7505292.1 mechanosensitive ion channel [Candidatus Acetothermia bacterium]